MYGVCPRRDTLLRDVTEAVSRYERSVAELSLISGGRDKNLFIALKDEADLFLKDARTAWSVYRKHVSEHGC